MSATFFENLSDTQALALIATYAVVLVVSVVAYATVVRKAGYSGWWVLILLVPLVNLVMIAVFAFSEWPVTRELKAARFALQQYEMGLQGQSTNRFSWGG